MGACVLCKEQITNPLSPQRLSEGITTWLADSTPELINEFQEEVRSLLDKNVSSNDYCIITGESMDMCVYCFSEHVFHWLEDQQLIAPLMDEYVTFFNFDITGGGYMKKFEEKYLRIGDLFSFETANPNMAIKPV